jgi:hypothetical protein
MGLCNHLSAGKQRDAPSAYNVYKFKCISITKKSCVHSSVGCKGREVSAYDYQ